MLTFKFLFFKLISLFHEFWKFYKSSKRVAALAYAVDFPSKKSVFTELASDSISTQAAGLFSIFSYTFGKQMCIRDRLYQ